MVEKAGGYREDLFNLMTPKGQWDPAWLETQCDLVILHYMLVYHVYLAFLRHIFEKES